MNNRLKTKLITIRLILDFGIYGFTRFTQTNLYYDQVMTNKNIKNNYRNNYVKQK